MRFYRLVVFVIVVLLFVVGCAELEKSATHFATDLIDRALTPETQQTDLPGAVAQSAVSENHLHVSKGVQECNWRQAMEGGLDSVHTSFHHRRCGVSGRAG